MSLRARILLFLCFLVAVSVLPLKAPWPVVVATGLYFVLVFPALGARGVLQPRATPTSDPAPTRLIRITGSPPHPDPTMQPPPSWWSLEQWDAATLAVKGCRCDPYDCGPYGHDPGCPAAMLSQGQYNAVKGAVDAR